MIKPECTDNAFLFIGSLFSSDNIFDAVLTTLTENFGNILYKTPTLPWNYTSHYNKELGTSIYRNFIFFEKSIDPSYLVDVKLITNEIERVFSHNNNRQINLDPGYITLAKVVLASTKNYSHRIYLGRAIYGELALLFKNGKFISLPYTYNDYKDEIYLNIFMKVRRLIKEKIGSD